MRHGRTPSDGDPVERRLADAQAALDDAWNVEAANLQAIYRARAQALASRRLQARPQATVALLVLAVGTERYAIELTQVAEVLPLQGCVRVPGARGEIVGAMNVRGEIRLVLDLARLLGVETATPVPSRHVVMLREPEVGWLVDRVEHVARVAADDEAFSGDLSRTVRGRTATGLLLISTSGLRSHPALGSA
ncbi:MAG: chemotaxis protein CheW [Candidatus Xenobia bacterium]